MCELSCIPPFVEISQYKYEFCGYVQTLLPNFCRSKRGNIPYSFSNLLVDIYSTCRTCTQAYLQDAPGSSSAFDGDNEIQPHFTILQRRIHEANVNKGSSSIQFVAALKDLEAVDGLELKWAVASPEGSMPTCPPACLPARPL